MTAGAPIGVGATVRSEWIKLRTVVVHWVLIALAIAFPLVITLLGAMFGSWVDVDLSDEIAGLVVGLAVVTAMLLGAMAATSLTSEYSHHTIRPTFAATPSRIRVHASKLVVLSTVVAAAAAVAVFGSWLVAQIVLSVRDLSASIASGSTLARLLSVVVLAVVVTWFGYGLGLLIRNAPATITILLLWPLIIESLIGGLFVVADWDGATKWLPYSAGIAAAVENGGGADDVLGRPWGLVWFGAVSLMLVVFGLLADTRRDA